MNKSLKLGYFYITKRLRYSWRRYLIYLLFGRFRFKSSPVVNSTSSELSFIGFFVLLLRWALALPSFFLPTHTISFLKNSLIVWMNSRKLILGQAPCGSVLFAQKQKPLGLKVVHYMRFRQK